MSTPDLPGISESDVYLAGDALALAREFHGPISDEQLEEAKDMSQAAFRAWLESP